MTQAKAQTVASALIGAGYLITLQKIDIDDFAITAFGGVDIDPQVIATFAANQAIMATVAQTKFF